MFIQLHVRGIFNNFIIPKETLTHSFKIQCGQINNLISESENFRNPGTFPAGYFIFCRKQLQYFTFWISVAILDICKPMKYNMVKISSELITYINIDTLQQGRRWHIGFSARVERTILPPWAFPDHIDQYGTVCQISRFHNKFVQEIMD